MADIEFSHKPVMFDEVMNGLAIKPDGIYIDGTAGGGGHSYGIASRLSPRGRLIATDRDEDAVEAAGKRLAPFADRVTIVKSNYADACAVLDSLGIDKADGVLLDLGVSSYQLDNAERGFSYMEDAPLDMRMDRSGGITAFDIVNGYSADELKRILYSYGEERFAPRIAAAIIKARENSPVRTTLELSDIVRAAIPSAAREGGHHPAKRTFQAIRIEVNGELAIIGPAVKALAMRLNTGGRIAVITFHSLEDRAVKEAYTGLYGGCTCPRDFPVCVCGKKPVLRAVGKKPVTASEKELEDNPRARSAKLRVAERV